MAGIIKAGSEQLYGNNPAAVEFNLHDFSNRADEYLRNVQQQANQILQQAHAQAEQIKLQAQQQGQQAAMQAAQQMVTDQVSAQLGTLKPALERAIESLRQAKHEWLEHWERNAIGLATAIAERVIRRELSQAPDITLDLIRESLDLAAGGSSLTVRMNPADYQSLGEGINELTQHFNGLSPTDIIADPEVEPGGCRVHTEFGSIDQQITTQLERIEEELSS